MSTGGLDSMSDYEVDSAALEIGRAFLSAQRAAASILAKAQREAEMLTAEVAQARGPATESGPVRRDAQAAGLAAQVDEIERALLRNHERVRDLLEPSDDTVGASVSSQPGGNGRPWPAGDGVAVNETMPARAWSGTPTEHQASPPDDRRGEPPVNGAPQAEPLRQIDAGASSLSGVEDSVDETVRDERDTDGAPLEAALPPVGDDTQTARSEVPSGTATPVGVPRVAPVTSDSWPAPRPAELIEVTPQIAAAQPPPQSLAQSAPTDTGTRPDTDAGAGTQARVRKDSPWVANIIAAAVALVLLGITLLLVNAL